jgi:hypothetical protein
MDAQQVLSEVKGKVSAAAAREAAGMEAGEAAGDTAGVDTALAEAGAAAEAPAVIVTAPSIEAGIEHLKREGALNVETLVGLTHHAARVQGKHSHRHGFRQGLNHHRRVRGAFMRPHDFPVPYGRSEDMKGFRYDVIQRFAEGNGGKVVSQAGEYYGTFQTAFTVSSFGGSSPTSGLFSIVVPPTPASSTYYVNPPADTCFDFSIGESDPNWFGGPHTMTLADTNLQYPGQGLYQKEVFIIEAWEARFKGLRIQFDTTKIPGFSALPLPIQAMLQGQACIWDRENLVLPSGIFNKLTDVCELAQALAEVASIQLEWVNLGPGSNNVVATKPLGRMCGNPSTYRRSVVETSGGGLALDLPRGYIWCQDETFQPNEDSGGNGLLYGQLLLNDNVDWPFPALASVYGSGPIVPTGIALEWQFKVYGTALLPSKADRRLNVQRRS